MVEGRPVLPKDACSGLRELFPSLQGLWVLPLLFLGLSFYPEEMETLCSHIFIRKERESENATCIYSMSDAVVSPSCTHAVKTLLQIPNEMPFTSPNKWLN